ncbi:hypothetical protein [Amycolatopsis panacis]|uniref:Uncharacterized protein n=1 Tax=Amycolatopsis panacis TaxID=2340917 RepID=A0A419IA27_9PSEU|nr:hypothetical protein [Amycolatopsis panacis]RJQ90013.1 hypothetical protein D5S19_03375 [Amycolatopsis panacis]
MTGYEADPARLREVAGRLTDRHTEFETGRGALQFSVRPDRAGEVLLAKSLERFQQASVRSRELVATDLAKLAERVRIAAEHYAAYEAEAEAVINEVGRATEESDADPNGIRKALG